MTNPQHFHEFFTQIFLTIFLWNQRCQQLKSPKPQHFHDFSPPKRDILFGKSKLTLWLQRSKVNPNSKTNFSSMLYFFSIDVCTLLNNTKYLLVQVATFSITLHSTLVKTLRKTRNLFKAYGLHSAPLEPKAWVEILRNLGYNAGLHIIFFFCVFCSLSFWVSASWLGIQREREMQEGKRFYIFLLKGRAAAEEEVEGT